MLKFFKLLPVVTLLILLIATVAGVCIGGPDQTPEVAPVLHPGAATGKLFVLVPGTRTGAKKMADWDELIASLLPDGDVLLMRYP
jgi:hypothetical protein